jgi:hypothetical protein
MTKISLRRRFWIEQGIPAKGFSALHSASYPLATILNDITTLELISNTTDVHSFTIYSISEQGTITTTNQTVSIKIR